MQLRDEDIFNILGVIAIGKEGRGLAEELAEVLSMHNVFE